jgi:hypothetical protein
MRIEKRSPNPLDSYKKKTITITSIYKIDEKHQSPQKRPVQQATTGKMNTFRQVVFEI